MVGVLTSDEEAQLAQTVEMFEAITQTQPQDYQSLEILREAYEKLGREQESLHTAKRIAQAYVMAGQLSSAILEYESVLVRSPEDAEAAVALSDLETKAKSLSAAQSSGDTVMLARAQPTKGKSADTTVKSAVKELDDGKAAMHKVFVEGKVIHQNDFDQCWVKPDLTLPPINVVEPFVQGLADKGIVPIEKSLRLLSDKARIGYLPLDRYDIDIEFARKFSADTCRRWCVLPVDRMSKSMVVVTANPFNRMAAQLLESQSSQRLLWYLAQPNDLVKLLRRVFR